MKILLIRFSSFGDVTQTLSVASALKTQFPHAEIHWCTRSEFVPLIETHPAVNCVWGLSKKDGIWGLLKLIYHLKKQKITHIYDAHNNLRSILISFSLTFNFHFLLNKILATMGLASPLVIRRSIRRMRRFLLFQFRINLFEQPFSGQRDLLEPLKPWGIPATLPPAPQIFFKKEVQDKIRQFLDENKITTPFITLAPSSAHALKKWPKEYWIQLIQEWKSHNFILLGGPEDLFLEEIKAIAPDRVWNFAGQLSFAESGVIIAFSQLLIANDTGLLHIAEQLGHSCIALMGPAPFGFPSRYNSTTILQRNLKCRPCSKHGQGPCHNAIFHECMRTIFPDEVMTRSIAILSKLQKNRDNKRG